MPTTLKDHAANEQSTYRDLLEEARSHLDDAQVQLRPRQPGAPSPTLYDDLKTKKNELKAKEELIAAKRQKLAITTVPSAATALVAEITALAIELNILYGQVLDAKHAVDETSARAAFAQSRVARFTARLATADKDLAAAEAEDGSRQSAIALIGSSLRTVPADAAALLASAELTASREKIAADKIPEKLMDLATLRHQACRHRLALAEGRVAKTKTQLADRAETDDGLAGEVVKRRIEHDVAVQALTSYVGTAKERLTRARDTIHRIGSGADLLTEDEHDDAFDSALLSDREAAQAKELAMLTAERDLDDAEDALADARIAARATVPDADDAEIDGVPGVANAIAARDAKQTALDTANDDYSATERETIRAWGSILPPSAWRSIVDLLEAEAALTELAAIDVDPVSATSVQQKLATAEGAYGDALAARAETERANVMLEEWVALERAHLETARAEENVRLVSAVRGDAT